jgi:hypothetical protein
MTTTIKNRCPRSGQEANKGRIDLSLPHHLEQHDPRIHLLHITTNLALAPFSDKMASLFYHLEKHNPKINLLSTTVKGCQLFTLTPSSRKS